MVRTRIAPSPTGKLHIGNARAALFNYLFSRQNGGIFILRIEDTNRELSKKEYEDDITGSLTWLSLTWDEFYRQSERIQIYKEYLEKLLEEGRAFYCSHRPEDTQGRVHFCEEREKSTKNQESRIKNQRSVIRFKTPREREIAFDDIIRGKVRFQTNELGDFSIAKSFDEPLFNFTNMVDDYEMKITHVIRGEDHLSNTPKQILLKEALGFGGPLYGHLPLILGKDRSKLSKRHGAVAVSEYRELGYLPQAMLNFMAFLGWNPGDEREFFSLEELIKEFSFERVKKGGSIFNIDKLDFINRYYIRKLSLEELREKSFPFFEKTFGKEVKNYDFNKLKDIIQLERERIATLSDFPAHLDFFFKDIDYPKSLLVWRQVSLVKIKENLEILMQIIEKISVSSYNESTLKTSLLKEIQIRGGERGEFLWPLRAALTGKKASAGPFEIAAILGKKESLARISYAIAKINQSRK